MISKKITTKTDQYVLVRSSRTTTAIHITASGSVEIRGPYHLTERQALQIYQGRQGWIEKHLQKIKDRQAKCIHQDAAEQESLRLRCVHFAGDYFPRRTAQLAMQFHQFGFTYQTVTVTGAKRSWGSCSLHNGQNRLHFSWQCALLYAQDPALCDYIILHELCHTIQHNHSPAFWALMEQVVPDYREKKKKIRAFEQNNLVEPPTFAEQNNW